MVKCIINTVEYEIQGLPQISEKISNVISTNFNIVIGSGQAYPRSGDIVRIKDTTTNEVYFIGVAGIPSSPAFNNLNQPKIYKMKCKNANAILKRRLVNIAVEDKTVTQIVQQLYDDIMADEGITLGSISTIDTTFDVYVSPNLDLQFILNELAERGNATWSINSDYEFNFTSRDDFGVFPETINSDFLIGTNLQHKTKDLDTRTVQVISGANEQTAEQTEDFVYTGDSNEFVTRYDIIKKPTIKVNTVTVPSANVGVRGFDDDDNNIYFLFSYNQPIVYYNENSSYLSATDDVQVIYFGSFPIRVEALNQDRIDEIATNTGTSGRIENVIQGNSLKTSADAIAFAETLLDSFSFERDEISFDVYQSEYSKLGLTLSDFDLNTKINIELDEIAVSGEFVIVERTLQPISAENIDSNWKVKLKLKNRNLLRGYGETFNAIDRQLASISIREDETIIQVLRTEETITMSETTTLSRSFEYFATSGVVDAVFEPSDFSGTGEGVFPV